MHLLLFTALLSLSNFLSSRRQKEFRCTPSMEGKEEAMSNEDGENQAGDRDRRSAVTLIGLVHVVMTTRASRSVGLFLKLLLSDPVNSIFNALIDLDLRFQFSDALLVEGFELLIVFLGLIRSLYCSGSI